MTKVRVECGTLQSACASVQRTPCVQLITQSFFFLNASTSVEQIRKPKTTAGSWQAKFGAQARVTRSVKSFSGGKLKAKERTSSGLIYVTAFLREKSMDAQSQFSRKGGTKTKKQRQDSSSVSKEGITVHSQGSKPRTSNHKMQRNVSKEVIRGRTNLCAKI